MEQETIRSSAFRSCRRNYSLMMTVERDGESDRILTWRSDLYLRPGL